jgi:uncharacterized protein with GYD domain
MAPFSRDANIWAGGYARMPSYILLLTLTPAGRGTMLEDPESLMRSANAIETHDTQVLGMYGVLGEYDFVGIVEAPGNDEIARYSLELGVSAGVHVTTLPAIPVARLQSRPPSELPDLEAEVTLSLPDDAEGHAPTEDMDG